jgi:Ring finger domain
MSYLRPTAEPLPFGGTKAYSSPLVSSSTTATLNNSIVITQDASASVSTWHDGTWLVTKAALKITGLTFIGLICLFVVKYYRSRQYARGLEQQQEYARQSDIREQQRKAINVKQKLKSVKWKDICVVNHTAFIKTDESTTATESDRSDDDIEAQAAYESDSKSSSSLSVSYTSNSGTSFSAPKSAETIPAPQLNDAEDNDDENTICFICLAHFQPSESVAMSNNADCKHIFHKDCIASWLVKQDGCPMCRRSYLDAEDKEKGESDNSHVDSMELNA